ncbi:hypothetical protein COU01_01065 [Candidatus Falkowbacteria bacterium CG10_big_fil_rev_8_21_14_0_10_44_15]|uniref:Uncharacterized protein n=1 Tax=Candidatus Falkowbacteria bacterium CG10_big_fil_rev_8_21_14_0_10_44_15 TaxID=1974569 RepID=A0A2H0V0F5_9BACT|nr:MAG: hypothetical protein COU01_01065 [Candidatus Falkowbacteria bacterium CG10_big_fil_rev_8_21_14_0_10_44_15]
MPNAEFIQSATQFVNQASELLNAGAKDNLIQTLTQVGHPYGLVFGMNTASWPSILLCPSASSILSSQWSENSTAPDPASLLPFSGLFSSNFLIAQTVMFEKFLKRNRRYNPNDEFNQYESVRKYDNANFGGRLSRRVEFSFEFKYQGTGFEASSYGFLLTLFSKSGLKWLANNSEGVDRLLNFQTILAPGILKSLTELGERPRNLRIGKNQIGLGSSSIHLTTYQGEKPYIVKSPQGEQIAQINPGEILGSVHVASQARLLKNLSPLKKVEQITQDFIDLLKAINQGGTPDLNESQQKTLTKAGQATIIGISHLVRLFRHRTGLPTWKLDVLPEIVQRFHSHDSQAVSQIFGGTRKVQLTDVEMMVITPQMRQVLVAAY